MSNYVCLMYKRTNYTIYYSNYIDLEFGPLFLLFSVALLPLLPSSKRTELLRLAEADVTVVKCEGAGTGLWAAGGRGRGASRGASFRCCLTIHCCWIQLPAAVGRDGAAVGGRRVISLRRVVTQKVTREVTLKVSGEVTLSHGEHIRNTPVAEGGAARAVRVKAAG